MAISINRIAWGLALIFAFSLGLASVLVTIGILLVSGSKLINKAKAAPKIIKILSLLGPCVIMVLGILIAIKSLKDMGLL
jgi:ABC-type nickel/cobalt efflux system permease component RcnA